MLETICDIMVDAYQRNWMQHTSHANMAELKDFKGVDECLKHNIIYQPKLII